MPSTSLSRLEAVFPVIEVLSIVAVATVKIPPPAPDAERMRGAIGPMGGGAIGAADRSPCTGRR